MRVGLRRLSPTYKTYKTRNRYRFRDSDEKRAGHPREAAGPEDRPDQSVMRIFSSSELPFNSGAYIAEPRVGRALNVPGISARIR